MIDAGSPAGTSDSRLIGEDAPQDTRGVFAAGVVDVRLYRERGREFEPLRRAADRVGAVLAVTHDPRTLPYADRIIRIEDGVIVGEKRQKVKPSGMTDITNGKIGAQV